MSFYLPITRKLQYKKILYLVPSHTCAIALSISVFALLNFVLHRRVELLVLASSSFRVSSSGHVLYHSRRRLRVSVVIGTYKNGIGLLPRFYFCSFQNFLSVSFGVAFRIFLSFWFARE